MRKKFLIRLDLCYQQRNLSVLRLELKKSLFGSDVKRNTSRFWGFCQKLWV